MDGSVADVVVIGGGVIGLSTAYHLAKDGTNVLLLEQFPMCHNRGSSHGHSRTIRYAYERSYYTNMMPDAFRMWEALEKETGDALLVRKGKIDIGPKGSRSIQNIENSMKTVGAPYERLNGSELAKRYPMWADVENSEAILDSTSGFMLADKILRALLRMIKHYGGMVRDLVQVHTIDTTSPDHIVIATSKGVINARKVVVAAGPWSKKILGTLNLHLPIQTLKVTVTYWKEKESGLHTHEKMPSFYDEGNDPSQGIYGVPSFEYPGLVKVCCHGGPTIDPDIPSNTTTTEHIDIVRQYIKWRLPMLETEPSVVEHCIYSMTPDMDFIIDLHPQCDRIVIGAGMSGHGFKMSIVTGRILADLATGTTPCHDISHFRIDRFWKSKL